MSTGPGGLDWRTHSVGPARPCRLCHRPAFCRDEHGRPCHKVCAERHLTHTPAAGSAAGLLDAA